MRIRRATFLSAVAALGLAAAIAGGLAARAHEPEEAAAPARAADDLPVEAIRRIVRDYLIEHPEVLLEAQEALRARRAERAAEQARGAIRRHHAELFRDPESPAAGAPAGGLALVEFFDYRCAHCRRVKPALDALLAENDDLRLIYKEFPILGPESTLAARAALAAREQGAYAAFHDALMAADAPPDRERLFAVARALGLDESRFTRDMEDPAIDAHLARNAALAQALGIAGTPGFVLGERLIRGAPSLPQLRDILARARAEEPSR